MAEIDKVKEKISFLKLLFSICVALLISLGSWLVNNKSGDIKYIIASVSFIFLLFTAISFFIKIIKNIKKLEDL
jgi:hypothetical protein